MRGRIVKLGAGAVVLAALAAGGAAWATGAGGSDEQPLEGSALDRATAAALAETGGGKVTEAESGDDGAAYSVEVELSDGSQIEIGTGLRFQGDGP